MMKVEGPSLELVQKAIGAVGIGSQHVEFPDGILNQTIDVMPMVRRGSSKQVVDGLGVLELINTHPGADTQLSQSAPYTLLEAAFPNVPYDVYLLSIIALRTAGAGGLTNARARVNYQATSAFSASSAFPFSAWADGWNAIVVAGGVDYFARVGTGEIAIYPRMRIPVGGVIGFESVSAAAATFSFRALLGIFPRGTGQDVAI